jgi:hypothetical protein
MFFKSKKEKNSFLESIKNQLELFFKEKSIHYESEDHFFRILINGNNTSWRMGIIIDERFKTIMIRSVYPFTVEDTRKFKIAELIVRINENIVLGNFDLNYEEGSVTFKTAHYCDDANISKDTFARLFFTQIHTFDDMFRAFAEVNFGDGEPALLALQLHQGGNN